MKKKKVLIIGAGIAGLSAVSYKETKAQIGDEVLKILDDKFPGFSSAGEEGA
ncbi:hypothetical protein [Natroniella sp. ANB-PHB2]|uniref:hypothetical protein n=1 Tax=Natroniella sp. ANB-PHB2 TaxID=3384444 RepID=UPI0038D46061